MLKLAAANSAARRLKISNLAPEPSILDSPSRVALGAHVGDGAGSAVRLDPSTLQALDPRVREGLTVRDLPVSFDTLVTVPIEPVQVQGAFAGAVVDSVVTGGSTCDGAPNNYGHTGGDECPSHTTCRRDSVCDNETCSGGHTCTRQHSCEPVNCPSGFSCNPPGAYAGVSELSLFDATSFVDPYVYEVRSYIGWMLHDSLVSARYYNYNR